MNTRTLSMALILLVMTGATYAYEVETHARLSENSFDASRLSKDPQLLQDLGLKNTDTFLNSQDSNPRTIKELFSDGSRFEDGITPCDDRPRNHFYDPLNDRGLSWLLISGKKSPDWALEDKGVIAGQQFSYQNAREYLYNALTANDSKQRDENFGLLFQSLGHVNHHVQDMAQPQHVRNDIHVNFGECWLKRLLGFTEDPSLYEQYTQGQGSNLPFGAQSPVKFGQPRHFWHTETKTPGSGKGLAEFTNTNFVSKDTNFLLQKDGSASPNARYKLPAPSGIWESVPIAHLLTEKGETVPCWTDANGTACLAGNIDFYGTDVHDRYRGTTEENRRAASLSIFDQDLQFYDKRVHYTLDDGGGPVDVVIGRAFTLNRFNFDEAHKFLIPRAVAYSAGLINHFFRGRLEIQDAGFSDQGLTLRVKNAIDEKIPEYQDHALEAGGTLVAAFDYKVVEGGVEKPKYDRTSPVTLTETLGPGRASNGVYTFSLPAIPEGAYDIRYRLVYRGQLGDEENGVAFGAFKPVSGFITTPNFTPTDSIAGPRNLYRLDTWKLSKATGSVGGNTDWKGWYVNGQPTKVLTYQGPSSRYFVDYGYSGGYSYVRVPFTENIYEGGEILAVAPWPVMGAAVNRDSEGKQWIVAICRIGNADVAFRRPYSRSTSAALYDAATSPGGWQELGRYEQQPGDFIAGTPWFFNGDGTEAQTMRERQGDQTKRLKVVLSGATAAFENKGNLGGYSGTRSCTQSVDDNGNVVAATKTSSESGDYVIAVDYRDNQEVLAIVNVEASSTYVWAGGSANSTSMHSETLKMGDARVPVLTTDNQKSASWSDSSYSETSASLYDAAEITYYLDLRYDLYSHYRWSWDTKGTYNRTDTTITGSTTQVFSESSTIVSRLAMPIVAHANSTTQTYTPTDHRFGSSGSGCSAYDNGDTGTRYGTNFGWTNNDGLRVSLAVDTDDNLFLSQRYYLQGGFLSTDGYSEITGGNLDLLFGFTGSRGAASYYPLRLVR